MPQIELQCPYCDTTSARPQGLAAHVRNRHPKQYPKWLKTPTRFQPASKGAASTAQPVSKTAEASDVVETAPVQEAASSTRPQVEPAIDLLNKAHENLIARRGEIEKELSRFDDLKKELEQVNIQLESLDKTLGVFSGKAAEPAEAEKVEETAEVPAEQA